MLEKYDFHDMVVSIKSSDVLMCAEAYRLVAEKIDYPLHVGITEAGTVFSGNIKSAVGLGIILNQGIGDTIRVSLTGDPVNEIASAKLILKTLGLRTGGIEVVSCPTCGRTNIDLISLANQVETMTSPFLIRSPSPLPPAIPTSASLASPGPFTTQPITATLRFRSSKSAAIVST